jgi:hypothetical protein
MLSLTRYITYFLRIMIQIHACQAIEKMPQSAQSI